MLEVPGEGPGVRVDVPRVLEAHFLPMLTMAGLQVNGRSWLTHIIECVP